MRTTITLDVDVAAMLARVQRDREIGKKAAVNEALRLGRREMARPASPRVPFRTKPMPVGRLLVDSVDNPIGSRNRPTGTALSWVISCAGNRSTRTW
ncbi:MAG: hypothetical protein EPO26_06980 [Chloroflexota bacterium]|nr:MAG: hypothetical protein EPO26_06980 [Chloroflexota bacterium]